MSKSENSSFNKHSEFDNSEFFFINQCGILIAIDPFWETAIMIDRVFGIGDFIFFGCNKQVFNENNIK